MQTFRFIIVLAVIMSINEVCFRLTAIKFGFSSFSVDERRKNGICL